MTTQTKICTGCLNEYPATSDYFHKNKPSPDGFHPKCKTCRSKLAAERYQRDADRILQKAAEWKRNNPDKVAAQAKKWAAENPDRIKAKVKRFKANNPGKTTEYCRRWRESHREQYRAIDRAYRTKNREQERLKAAKAYDNNTERYRAYSRNRYALKWSVGTHTAEDVTRQYEKQQGCCFWCSEPVNQLYQVDHVIPISRGGSNSPDNLVIACPSCNRHKQKLLPYVEWTPPNPLKLT